MVNQTNRLKSQMFRLTVNPLPPVGISSNGDHRLSVLSQPQRTSAVLAPPFLFIQTTHISRPIVHKGIVAELSVTFKGENAKLFSITENPRNESSAVPAPRDEAGMSKTDYGLESAKPDLQSTLRSPVRA